jgi:hypothetical protein
MENLAHGNEEGVMKMTIRAALAMFCAAMLLFAAEAARAASPAETGGTPPSDAKPDAATAEKPDEDGGSPSAASRAGESGGTVRLKDLVSDGFVIRTTVFIPDDAVTRQSGKVSSDAIVLTLQKQTSTAVCYYTFKAYVGGVLGAIQSCVVHR